METQTLTAERASDRRSRFLAGFGKRVRELRRESGMRQGELARAVGVSHSTLCYIEKGRHTPRLDTAMRIVDVFRSRAPGGETLTLDALVYAEGPTQ